MNTSGFLRCLLLLLAASFLTAACPPATAAEHVYSSGGVHIRCVDEGAAAGEAVVLIHGFSRNVELTWIETGVVDALAAEGFRALAIDCRGHGKSGRPLDEGAYGARMVEDVVRLLDHFGVERAHVVGYSMGGRIALRLAVDHPERVRSVALIGSGGERTGADHALWDAVADGLARGEGIRPLIEFLFPGAPEEVVRAVNGETMSRNDARVLELVARGFRDWATTAEELRGLRVQMLAIVGENDPFRPAVEALRRDVGSLPVQFIPGADHVSTLESPEFASALLRFLREACDAGGQE